jgi:hypothetical protein
LDIIIHDKMDYSPIFCSGELVIVLPASVVGILEVKKTLWAGDLSDALDTIAKTMDLLHLWNDPSASPAYERVFTGIFAFASPRRRQTARQHKERPRKPSKKLPKVFEKKYRKVCWEHAPRIGVPDLLIVADGGPILHRRQTNEGGPLVVHHGSSIVAKPNSAGESLNISGQELLLALSEKAKMAECRSAISRWSFPTDMGFQEAFRFDNAAEPLRGT